jgi:hypothetical protein
LQFDLGQEFNQSVPAGHVLFALVVPHHFWNSHRIAYVRILGCPQNVLLALVEGRHNFPGEAAGIPSRSVVGIAFLEAKTVERGVDHFSEELGGEAKPVGDEGVVYRIMD